MEPKLFFFFSTGLFFCLMGRRNFLELLKIEYSDNLKWVLQYFSL